MQRQLPVSVDTPPRQNEWVPRATINHEKPREWNDDSRVIDESYVSLFNRRVNVLTACV